MTLDDVFALIIVVEVLLLFPIGLPLSNYIEYKIYCKKYGKEIADELMRRM